MKKATYSRTKNSLLNLITGVGGQLLMSVLRFVSRTVFIQVLGASYLGIGGLFSNILTLLSLTELGLDTAINFRLYKPLSNNDETRVRILMKFYKQAYLVIGGTIFFLGLVMIPVLPYLIKDYDALISLDINAPIIFILYLLQSVTSYLFFAYRTIIIKTAQKEYILNITDFFFNIVITLLQIAVLIWMEDFLIYISVIIVFNFIKNFVNAVIARRMFPFAFKPESQSITKEERNSIFKDCGALFLFKVSHVVLLATDNLVLSSFIGIAIVGVYSNYLLFYTTINHFLAHFYRSVKASMGNLYVQASVEKNYFMFEVMNFVTILLKGTAGVGVAICSNEIISIWIGDDYVIPQPFPTLLGIQILFNGLKINLGQVRNISGAFRQAWFRPAIGVIINVVVSIILCQYIGIIGVVIGTITADVLANFMIDPKIIHKVSFHGYKPVSFYYKKNILFIFVLFFIGILDFGLCHYILFPYKIVSLIIHVLICLVSVPLGFYLLYQRTEVCQYLVQKILAKK